MKSRVHKGAEETAIVAMGVAELTEMVIELRAGMEEMRRMIAELKRRIFKLDEGEK